MNMWQKLHKLIQDEQITAEYMHMLVSLDKQSPMRDHGFRHLIDVGVITEEEYQMFLLSEVDVA